MKNLTPAIVSIGIVTIVITEIIVLHSFWTALLILFVHVVWE